MAKKNFKQPILQWIGKGNNSRRNEETVVDAFRADHPELKKCPDQTVIDYFRRFGKGMRAKEPKAPTKDGAKLFIKTSSKKTK